MTRPCTLYRLFDVDDALLYVGIAGNPGRRFEQHAKDKPWWSEVDHIGLEHYDERVDAETAERHAIRTEKPRHNIAHNAGTRLAPSLDLVWICDECDGPIANGFGYLDVRLRDIAGTRGLPDLPERYEGDDFERDYEGASNDNEDEGPLTFSSLMDRPDAAEWRALHASCGPEPDEPSYCINVGRIRTWPQVLNWTAHLMGKGWLKDTDWDELLVTIAQQGLPPSMEAL